MARFLFVSGDGLLEKYCKKDGAVDMTMAWEVLDWYKKAALATREIEVEMEAIALSRIGKLYDEVFTIKSKARENFKRAIELAISMHPRTFNNEGEKCLYIPHPAALFSILAYRISFLTIFSL